MKLLKLTTIALFSLFIFQCSSEDDTPNPTTNTDPDPDPVAITLTDADGNIYDTVTIGGQIWMAENLKTTSYNDGTPIALATFEDDWFNGITELAFYQWADTNDLGNMFNEELPIDYYGAIYNYFAIETGNLAPEGWRIPTKADFEALENYIANNGFDGQEGDALKATTGWSTSSGNGVDAFGFNALPSGYASTQGTATGAPIICTWATTDVITSSQLRETVTLDENPTLSFDQNSNRLGTVIRLIKE